MADQKLMPAAVYAIADFAGLIKDEAVSDAARGVARLGRARLVAAVTAFNPTLTTLPGSMPVLTAIHATVLVEAMARAEEDLRRVSILALESDAAHGPALRAASRIKVALKMAGS